MDQDQKLCPLSEEDFRVALQEMSTYIDVTEEDLYRLYKLAIKHYKLRLARSIMVDTVMVKELYTLQPGASLLDAARLLSEKRISSLPVVDDENHLLGLIGESVFLMALQDEPEHSIWDTLGHLIQGDKIKHSSGNTVAELMTKEVITVKKEDDIQKAVDLMVEHRIKRVIVVDDENRVEGIVSRADIIKLYLETHSR